ncbi:MAG: cytochrome P450 [Thermoplasmataceae archaeon]
MPLPGHETTTTLVGNGFCSLLKHRDKFSELQADRSLMHTAIEELLRFESPVLRMSRVALEDVTISDVRIQKGSMVAGVIGSANRDPGVFSKPESLDLKRAKKPASCVRKRYSFLPRGSTCQAGSIHRL